MEKIVNKTGQSSTDLQPVSCFKKEPTKSYIHDPLKPYPALIPKDCLAWVAGLYNRGLYTGVRR